jgi:hypothetical protein
MTRLEQRQIFTRLVLRAKRAGILKECFPAAGTAIIEIPLPRAAAPTPRPEPGARAPVFPVPR